MAALASKVALVTGGARGIGRALGLELAHRGAHVVLVDRDRAALEALQNDPALRDLEWQAQTADVSDHSQVAGLFSAVARSHGRLDLLVNNAGVQLNKPSLELTLEDWRQVLSVNLDAVMLCSQAAARLMMDHGGGCIVNLASIAGPVTVLPRRLPYCVSKAGVVALTKVLALEWAQYNIRVNAVAPGYVDTELVRHALQQGFLDEAQLRHDIPAGRLASPQEIAGVVAFLASDDASYITGQVIVADGGLSLA